MGGPREETPASKVSLVWRWLESDSDEQSGKAKVSAEGTLKGDFLTGVTRVMRKDRRKGRRHTAPRPGGGSFGNDGHSLWLRAGGSVREEGCQSDTPPLL